MAKSKNLYTRGLSQRLAGAVWYQRKGETVVRELAPQVSNPQTTAQMEQRAKLANLVAVYRANRYWMHWGAFENKKENWSDYNAFVSKNQNVSAVYLTKSDVASGAAVVAEYVVSAGSLPRINITASSDVLISDIFVGDLQVLDNTPVATLSAAIIANNNALREGDQLSFIVNIQQSTASVPYVTARAYELILDTANTQTLEELGMSGLLSTEAMGGANCLAMQLPSEQGGGTIVLSRDTTSGLKVSSQNIVITDLQASYLASFRTSSAKTAYYRSYAGGENANFLSGGYSGGASDSVSLVQQIMSVNGVAAGAYYGNLGDRATDPMVVVMANAVDSVTSATLSLAGNNQYAIDTIAVQGSTINLTIGSVGSLLGNKVLSLTLVIDADTYTINFASTVPEIQE